MSDKLLCSWKQATFTSVSQTLNDSLENGKSPRQIVHAHNM